MIVLATYAIEQERIDLHFNNAEVVQIATGIGKVQAAVHTTCAIMQYRPQLVLNYGTAGTLNHAVGDILVCRDFVDRDLDAVALPGLVSHIESETALAQAGLTEEWRSQTPDESATFLSHTCNTGDSFVTDAGYLTGDAIDMEAFAQAAACRLLDVPFIAVKYITDVVGNNSIRQWEEKLADARKALTRYFGNRTLTNRP